MKNKIAILLLAAALPLAGCKKLDSLLHRFEKPVAEAPKPAPTPVPPPKPAPTPTPVSINKSAAVMALCYHRFEDRPHDALAISPADFEKQMQGLKDAGFTVIGMQDFLAWRRGEKDIPAKSALITIDDGYISGYEIAWPILKKFNYPFTMFIYIDYIASGGKSMTWDQLAEMRDAGVDIQSHSYSHSNLKHPGSLVDKRTQVRVAQDIQALGMDGWLRKEIVGSKQFLEKRLGIRANVFAYPFGKYNPKALELVKEAGYEAAFTVYGQRLTQGSPADLLGRYAIESNKPQTFQTALEMVGGGGGQSMDESAYSAAVPASSSMITQPMGGETISDPKPVIKANLATLGDLDPKSVEMRVSGFGLVPAQYDAATKTVSYQVTQKLRDKNYTVIISGKAGGKRVETRWDFNFDPNAAPETTPATPAAPAPGQPAAQTPPKA